MKMKSDYIDGNPKKALRNIANQLSSAISSILDKLLKELQLGLGRLAIFEGLRPVTEAIEIEGVGKFMTYTVGEV
ncbi:MAG: hypothetical protein NZ937_06325 [Armatimonadetes bacterium]|nr:hypothetical protein [Armatimonadota bacterium]